jgi:thiosulfate/3-mercaptopyruvate sulfurtransferase
VTLALALGLIGLLASSAPPPASWPSVFVSVEDVPVALDDVIVVDARGDAEFKAGHPPGAVHMQWWRYRDGLLRTGKLPSDLNQLASDLAAIGVDGRKRVLVCGAARQGWGEEGRAAWTLRLLGHRAVAILDGGCQTWRRAGRPWTKGKSKAKRGQFVSRPNPMLRASKNDVRRALATGGSQLVDARTREEFDGATPSMSARGGHVPGARHLHFKDLLDDQGRALTRDKARARLVAAGIDPDKPVIAYCTGGVRSAFVVEAMRSAGVDARNYDGSWWEWSADDTLPVELPASR